MPKDIYDKLKEDFARVEAGAAHITQIDNAAGQATEDPTDYFRPHFSGSGEPNGVFALYDPNNPDDALFDGIEQEAIALSSPPLKWFRLDRENTAAITDRVTGESQMRYYHNHIIIVGNYEAPEIEQALSRFGIEEQEEIEVVFNLNYIVNVCAKHGFKQKKLWEGDVIQTVDGKLWEVIDSVVDAEALWTKGHNRTVLKRIYGEGYKLPGIGDVSDSPLHGTPDGHNEKGDGHKKPGSTEGSEGNDWELM